MSFAAIMTVLCVTSPIGAQVTTSNAARPDSAQITLLATRAEFGAARAESNEASPSASTVAPTLSLAPTRDGATAALRLRTEGFQPMPAPAPGKNSGNTALMIVGGAAFIAGAVIGGDAGTIIMVGGAGVGLYGLWQYLK